MKKITQGIIVTTMLVILSGCTPTTVPNTNTAQITPPPDLKLKSEEGMVQIVDLEDHYKDYKYTLVEGIIDKQSKDFIFDTEKRELLKPTPENTKLLEDKKYDVMNDNNGIIKVFDIATNEVLYTLDLAKELNIQNSGPLSVSTGWSNSQRYVYAFISNLRKTVLIDLETKDKVQIPVEGTVSSITWSPDDKKAVLTRPSNFDGKAGDVKTFLWDMESGKIQELKGEFKKLLKWTPGGKYLYVIEGKDGAGYKMERYDVAKGEWQRVSVTNRSTLEEGFIKWISDDVLLFPASGKAGGQVEYFAVKADFRSGETVEKKLEAEDIRDYMWNVDGNYFYYLDKYGFHEIEVGFGR